MASRSKSSIFSLGVDYSGSIHPDLPECPTDAERIDQFFQGWGFTPACDPGDLSTADAALIRDAIERWSDEIRASGGVGALVLYLGGHGRMHLGRHYTLAANSPAAPPYGGSKAIRADDLVEHLLNSGAKRALILLDVCHAGFAAAQVQQSVAQAAAAQAGPIMDLAVLVSCLHHEKSYSGAFVDALLCSLEQGSPQGHWKDGDEYVTLQELRDELRDRLQDEQCAEVAGRSGLKIVPNPRYRADAAARSAEAGELLRHLAPADREHFLRKAASTDAIDVGWFFTGRHRPSVRAVEWIGKADRGVLVVTGAPGAGKSAFLGRLAVLADRDSQSACRTLGMLDGDPATRPEVGAFDAVTHLKNRRVDDVALDIAQQLGIDVADSSSPARDLVLALADSGRRVTVLADALDEAERGEEEFVARDVLRAIGNLDGCTVVVGTRRDRDGRHDATPDDPGPLVSALRPRGGSFQILDLSADPVAEDDIAQYVADRLADRWPDLERRLVAAREVAVQSSRIFLYARFALRVLEGLPETVVHQLGWQDRLPSDVGAAGLHEVFAEDLQRFDDPVAIREVLTPLAFARGAGLPRRQVWPALATELSSTGRAYRDTDIARVIREAGWYLTEATEDGQAVYRLYHQAIADYLAQAVCDAG
ncbi:caspase family protein [Micromonospora sp. AMSO12t]|uniref:caspase family protein n=1 Tax=Micromonospora sp. AMSO12t TaxID=2650410 RepID=UPI001788C55C|nr:caspase family protein [Micromonospora sp. AMSO12t]